MEAIIFFLSILALAILIFNLSSKVNTQETIQRSNLRAISEMREEINKLKSISNQPRTPAPVATTSNIAQQVPALQNYTEATASSPIAPKEEKEVKPQPTFSNNRGAFEKFVGENLISKIGIAITVIGVSIGVKQ